MKKTIILIVTAFFILSLGGIHIYAATNKNVISGLSDIDEDLADYKDYIFNECKSTLQHTEKPITESDIRYDKAVKYYKNFEFSDKETFSYEEMQQYLKTAEYFYYIPVLLDENTAYVLLDKGLPVSEETKNNPSLTEKDIEQLENTAGKWHVYSIDVFELEFDYIKQVENLLEKYNIKNAQTFILDGPGENLGDTLAVFQKDSDAEFIRLEDMDENGSIIANTDFGERPYSYEEIKKLDELTEALYSSLKYSGDEPIITGYGSSYHDLTYAFFAGGAVFAAGAAALIINFALKKKAKTIK